MESKEDRKNEPGVELIEMNKFEDDRAKIGKKRRSMLTDMWDNIKI